MNAAMMVVRPDQDATGNLQDRNSTASSPAAFTGIGLSNASTHKLRMEWDAASAQATFLFDTNNDSGPGVYDFSYTRSVLTTTFNSANSRLFIGGGNGLSFDNFVVTSQSHPLLCLAVWPCSGCCAAVGTEFVHSEEI